MKVADILSTEFDEALLNEGVRRAFKKVGKKLKKVFRCSSGMKKGKTVSDPKTCNKRKDLKKSRRLKKTLRSKGRTIRRKTKKTKARALSKRLVRLNKRGKR